MISNSGHITIDYYVLILPTSIRFILVTYCISSEALSYLFNTLQSFFYCTIKSLAAIAAQPKPNTMQGGLWQTAKTAAVVAFGPKAMRPQPGGGAGEKARAVRADQPISRRPAPSGQCGTVTEAEGYWHRIRRMGPRVFCSGVA